MTKDLKVDRVKLVKAMEAFLRREETVVEDAIKKDEEAVEEVVQQLRDVAEALSKGERYQVQDQPNEQGNYLELRPGEGRVVGLKCLPNFRNGSRKDRFAHLRPLRAEIELLKLSNEESITLDNESDYTRYLGHDSKDEK